MATPDELMQTFADYVSGKLDTSLLEESVYNAILASISGATRQEALDIAKSIVGAMITGINQTTLDGVRQIISNGLEDQVGVPGIARRLKEQIGLSPKQVDEVDNLRRQLKEQGLSDSEIEKQIAKATKQKIQDRAEMIAQNEARDAIQQSETEFHKKQGFTYKVWISSQDSKVSDICRANEAQGPIPIDQSFSSGSKNPPGHSLCRCALAFVTDQLKDLAIERAKDRVDRTDAAKEKANK